MKTTLQERNTTKLAASLIIACAVCLCLAVCAFADGIAADVQMNGITEENYFTAHPGVYEMGDGYAVIWASSFDGIGYITYTYEGVEYTVYDEIDGVLKTDEDIHVVKVPHEHLSDNEYTVYSVEVLSHVGDKIVYGDTISAGPIKLKGYDGGDTIDILALTDIHTHLDRVMETVSHVTTDPDLIVVLGDTTEFIAQRSHIVDDLFNIAGTVSGGQYPIVYCRGNHETMGEYASLLREYFPAETDGMYYDFNFGPLYAVVVDTGSDGTDTEYANTLNFADYKIIEESWLRGIEPDTSAAYRIVINHIPYVNELPDGADLSESLAHFGFQIGLSGHEHIYELMSVGAYGVDYPVYICGGRNDELGYVASVITLDGNEARIKSISMDGTTVNELTVPLEGTYGEKAAQEEAYAGLTSQVKLRNTTAITILNTPVVMESGEDYYTIVWATDVVCSGGIEYTYGGKDYQLFEVVSGEKRFDTIHSVQVPKAHLNGNEYKLVGFTMGKFYPYEPLRGKGVVSQAYTFTDVTALKNAKAVEVTAVEQEITEEVISAYIISDGILGSYDTEEDIVELYKFAGELSGGKLPVILERDEDGYSGAYGAKLARYIGGGGIVETEGDEAKVYFPGSENELTYAVEDKTPDKAGDKFGLAKFMYYVYSRIFRRYY